MDFPLNLCLMFLSANSTLTSLRAVLLSVPVDSLTLQKSTRNKKEKKGCSGETETSHQDTDGEEDGEKSLILG